MKLRGVGSLVEIRTSDQSLVLREDGSRGVGSPVGAEPLSVWMSSCLSGPVPNNGDVIMC